MRLTKQDLLRLPKERLAEIIVEMQEKEMTLIPTPSITPPTPSIYTKPCIYAPNGQCDYYGSCWLCPHKQIMGTTFSGDANSTTNEEIHAYGNSKDNKGYQPSGKNKELCIYNDGAFCKKGLPGTQCDVVGCVAYEER